MFEGSELREDNKRFAKELQKKFVGVHARGVGPVYLDKDSVENGKVVFEAAYVLDSEAIAGRFGLSDSMVVFSDTLKYIDELIIDELALEATLEGNRFGDLIRFAKRREAWGDSEYRDFLAKRVASRAGTETFDDTLYVRLSSSEERWYLPLK